MSVINTPTPVTPTTPVIEFIPDTPLLLGHIAKKYESGGAGPGTISDVQGDGGGKAYGVFQMDSHFSHLKRYVESSQYKEILKKHQLASAEFDSEWKKIAELDPTQFEAEQYSYIKKVVYDPAIPHATAQGYVITHPAIQELVFSLAVQHGGYRAILKGARRHKEFSYQDVTAQVVTVFETRKTYVNGLRSLSDRVKRSLHRRYDAELMDVLALI